MPRRPKIQIKLGDKASLQSLLEDIHFDTTSFKNQVIRELSLVSNSAELSDDHAVFQITKVKTNLLGLLNNNTNNKLILAKMLASLMESYKINDDDKSSVSLRDFSQIRKMINEQNDKNKL